MTKVQGKSIWLTQGDTLELNVVLKTKDGHDSRCLGYPVRRDGISCGRHKGNGERFHRSRNPVS